VRSRMVRSSSATGTATKLELPIAAMRPHMYGALTVHHLPVRAPPSNAGVARGIPWCYRRPHAEKFKESITALVRQADVGDVVLVACRII